MSLDHASATRTTSLASGTRPQLKRKRSAIEVERVYEDAHVAVLRSRDGPTARKIAPICLIPRAQLPLAWLDPTGDGVQHLVGDMLMLDDKGRNEAVVVVAEDQASKRLFAVERAGSKAYALCRLANTIDQRVVRSRALVRYRIVQLEQVQAAAGLARKRQHLLTTPPRSSSPIEEKLAQSASLIVPTEHTSASPRAPTTMMPLPSTIPAIVAADENLIQPANLPETSTEAGIENLLQDLTKQYLDALYLSRTSVAYFVKGPLSRARHTAGANLLELAAHLREMLLSISSTDKRQRETLPELIKEFLLPADADEKETRKPRRTKWRAKRDKSGLLHEERWHVKRWWQCDQEDEVDVTDALSVHITKRLQRLRKRETFLQITLVLEAMISESFESKDKSAAPLHGDVDAVKKKSRKDIDLQTLLEALLDRLTIWHSVDFSSPDKKSLIGSSTGAETSDELRSFCTEVIIPFYMARLPKTASFVNKKLGGPSAPTPDKRKSSSRRPGEPTKRPSSDKIQRRSLKPTTTDSSLPTQRMAPSLERSVTDPQAQHPRIKREHSASLSLSSVPAVRPSQLSQALASLSRREIDLAAVTTATENRLRRKAEQEARVREAVASIRRPDRALALKENAAQVDATFAKTVANKKGQQNGIHIAATPAVARYVAATPRKGDGTDIPGYTTAYLAPPRLQAIPQTEHRERVINHSMLTPAINEAEEPASGYAFPGDLNETPVVSRTKVIEATPSRPRAATVLATPITKSCSTFQARLMPPLAEMNINITTTSPVAEKPVYDLLGWDNDDYEELA